MDYPLGHDKDEVIRLKKQMVLLFPEEFVSLVRPNENFLDIGCGSGDIISLLPETVSYTGLDLKNIVRPVYLRQSHVKIVENDAFDWDFQPTFTFINFRLVLWSVSSPSALIEKYLVPKTVRFFIYEPDDLGLKFSPGLASLGELAVNWRSHVVPSGKDPLIGSKLPRLLNESKISDFMFKEKIHRREGTSLDILKEAATNLCGIFSKYPGSESLKAKVLADIQQAKEYDWFEEKYCYAYRG